MKRTLVIAALALGGFSSAQAADLAPRTYTKAPPVMVEPVYDWTGFYIGVNAGYGWGQETHTNQNQLPSGGNWTNAFGDAITAKRTGAVYGGQIGYNWQAAHWVFGLEGQFDGASLKKTVANPFFPAAIGATLTEKTDFYATATGRVGYAIDSWLPYVKGGYAGARLKTTDSDIFNDSLVHSSWRNGFVVGGGLEYLVARNWVIGIEYDYMNFGSKSFSGTSTGPFVLPIADNFKDKLSVQAVTGRVSYKFGGPVLAKY